MSSISMPVPSRERFAMSRTAAYSASLVLNITAMMLLMIPLAPRLIRTLRPDASPLAITFVPPPVVIAQPAPPLPMPLPRHPAAVTHAVTHTHAVTSPVVAPVTEPSPVAVSAAPSVPTPPSASLEPLAPLEGVSLGYQSTPVPVYPAKARAMHWGGTVTLRVLVDTDGKPIQVIVDQSSGHPELDAVARVQVLSKWIFRPLIMNGVARQAWARVPVTFNLR